jgi:hypothetical protein
VHSSVVAMDRQFCRRDMDVGVKKDISSVMEDFIGLDIAEQSLRDVFNHRMCRSTSTISLLVSM